MLRMPAGTRPADPPREGEQVTDLEAGRAADLPGRAWHQPDDREGAHRLAAAEFADDRHGFALAYARGDAVDRLDHAGMAAELDREVLDLQKRRHVVGQPLAAGAGGCTSSRPVCATAALGSPPPATVTVGKANSMPLALNAFLIMP